MKDPAELKRQLVCAMAHLDKALDQTEDRELQTAIKDAMYHMSRRLKASSQLDIPVPTSATIKRFQAVREN